MCFTPSLQYKIIVFCGILVAAFGITTLIMAIYISVKSTLLNDILTEADETNSFTGVVKAF